MIDLSGIVPVAVDKHSTGGVGDKTTLVVEPTVAACGLPVAKMSGRGLGFTGGTLDKLESIPGTRVDLTTEEFLQQLQSIGLVLSGQTADLAPADGKLYALRDVTGTVQSIPLIASSVMSKKIAAGAQAIVLDVKLGKGAFMPDLQQAHILAETMVWIAKQTGREALALLSDMNQPLGKAVGNAVEVREALDTLRGDGPEDFLQHCLVVASHMLVMGRVASDEQQAEAMAEKAISSGAALELFRKLIQAQGGDISYVDNPQKLPLDSRIEHLLAPRAGYLLQVEARRVGEASVLLGAGRARKGDPIDHSVGILVHHKVGDYVELGEPLFTIYANREIGLPEARRYLQDAVEFSEERVEPLPLFYEVVRISEKLPEF
jgi:pyrimidine-nucleoside phosphorylase